MVITDSAAAPGPLLARFWPRMAERFAERFTDRAAPDLLDWALAACCFAAFTVPVLLGAGSAAGSPGAQLTWTSAAGTEAVFGALAAAPLVVRRRWPVAVVLIVTGVYVAAALADVSFTPFISNAGPNLAIAVFTAANRDWRRRSLVAAGVAGGATWVSLPIAMYLHPHRDQDAVQLFAVIVAWLIGDMTSAIREYRRQLQLAERRRAVEELQLARAEERLRLSRDVHDVVSHSLSTIAVQAGVARLVLAEQPGQAGAALSAIETASRSALDELRGLLRQIRDPQEADEAAAPTLGDLPALIARLCRAGLDVSYRSVGEPRPYGAATEMSAYRIAQEALTNVTKHASGAQARVEIEHGADELVVTVTDSGSSGARGSSGSADNGRGGSVGSGGRGGGRDRGGSAGSGLGIPGMRERAKLLGGTLTAGPDRSGGFVVVARLPVEKKDEGRS